MTVFRIHIRPTGGGNDQEASFNYCLKQGLVGMGWPVEETGKSRLSWDEYIAAAKDKYGYRAVESPRYMNRNVKANDLIWTRDTNGKYYLGRITCPWEYLADEVSLRFDIVNFCRCERILPCRVDEVPGKVVACFRPPRVIQAIRDATMTTYSKILWNKLSQTEHYSLESQADTDVYAFLDDQATENAVAIYLQMRGWLLLPETRKADTMGYEYILIQRETLEKAVVQVKTGNTSLDQDEWWSNFGKNGVKIFLFQSYGNYTGSKHREVECIDPVELQTFLFSERQVLPQSIRYWVDFVTSTPPA